MRYFLLENFSIFIEIIVIILTFILLFCFLIHIFKTQKKHCFYNVNYILVGKTGFEPATPWSQTKCSTKLSHFPLYGALEGIRTPDLLVRSQTLYPTELRAHNRQFTQLNTSQ